MTVIEPEDSAQDLAFPALERIADLQMVLRQASQAADESLRQHIFSLYLQGKKPNTQRRRRTDLARFRVYLDAMLAERGMTLVDDAGEPIDLADDRSLPLWGELSHGLVRAMTEWFLAKGYTLETINNTLSTVKVFAALAAQAGVLDTTELLRIEKVAGFRGSRARERDHERPVRRLGHKKAEATVLSDEQVLLLLEVPFEKARMTGIITPQNWRDAFLLRLLFELGVRPGELVTRTLADLDLRQGLLRIERHKTEDREQWLELSREAILAAGNYLDARPERLQLSDPLLLPTNKTGIIVQWRDESGPHGKERKPTPGLSARNLAERVHTLGLKIGVNLNGYDPRHKWADATVNHPDNNLVVLTDAGGWSADSPMLRRYYGYKKIANKGVRLSWKDGKRRE